MPANSRCHVIEQFNNAIVNVIIASDTDAALAADTSEGAVCFSLIAKFKGLMAHRIHLTFFYIAFILKFPF